MSAEFDARNAAEWLVSIARQFGQKIPQSATFEPPEQIAEMLNAFCGPQLNHTMLPRGGGTDMQEVYFDPRHRVIEFYPEPDRGGATYQARPAKLYFEYFPGSPVNSFLLLECARLEPSGAYEQVSRDYEEVVDLSEWEFVDRSAWDQGYYGHDEAGVEKPLPPDARLVVRLLSGKFLMVAKSSLWNRNPDTYDGRHSRMTAAQIRSVIQNTLDAIEERRRAT